MAKRERERLGSGKLTCEFLPLSLVVCRVGWLVSAQCVENLEFEGGLKNWGPPCVYIHSPSPPLSRDRVAGGECTPIQQLKFYDITGGKRMALPDLGLSLNF